MKEKKKRKLCDSQKHFSHSFFVYKQVARVPDKLGVADLVKISLCLFIESENLVPSRKGLATRPFPESVQSSLQPYTLYKSQFSIFPSISRSPM
jgi:hypothetical protein